MHKPKQLDSSIPVYAPKFFCKKSVSIWQSYRQNYIAGYDVDVHL